MQVVLFALLLVGAPCHGLLFDQRLRVGPPRLCTRLHHVNKVSSTPEELHVLAQQLAICPPVDVATRLSSTLPSLSSAQQNSLLSRLFSALGQQRNASTSLAATSDLVASLSSAGAIKVSAFTTAAQCSALCKMHQYHAAAEAFNSLRARHRKSLDSGRSITIDAVCWAAGARAVGNARPWEELISLLDAAHADLQAQAQAEGLRGSDKEGRSKRDGRDGGVLAAVNAAMTNLKYAPFSPSTTERAVSLLAWLRARSLTPSTVTMDSYLSVLAAHASLGKVSAS